MTEHYDVERTITSLGIGEALVTVLSPKGVPTPLAATRLVPPDSRMAPLTDAEIAEVVAASPLASRYGQAIDRESAHEIITARLATAHAAAEAAAGPGPATAAGAAVGTGAGTGTMTEAQYQREINRRAREMEKERREAERERKRQEREAAAAARQRERMVETSIRTAGRVATSRVGQSILRGVFDTIFGTGRRR